MVSKNEVQLRSVENDVNLKQFSSYKTVGSNFFSLVTIEV